jgi:hypothetical protein
MSNGGSREGRREEKEVGENRGSEKKYFGLTSR